MTHERSPHSVNTVVRVLRAGARRARAGNGGFSLIEVVVVMVIAAVLIALIIPMFSGAKSASNAREIAGAARAYAEAIRNFQLDHNHRAPVMGTVDWLTSPMAIEKGPVDNSVSSAFPDKYYYLGGSVPDVIRSRRAIIINGPLPSYGLPGSEVGFIRYSAAANSSTWQLTVRVLQPDGTFKIFCRITNDNSGAPDVC